MESYLLIITLENRFLFFSCKPFENEKRKKSILPLSLSFSLDLYFKKEISRVATRITRGERESHTRRFDLSWFHAGWNFAGGPVCARRDSCIEGEWQGCIARGVAMSDRLASRGKYVEYLNKSKQPK